MMVEQENPHLSYLLRLWSVQNNEGRRWRYSLENVQTGERHGFASLETLCAFLGEETSPESEDELADDVVE
ncbi:MAG: hypothetical protein GY803_17490 [Chloroflexi bacterium]|nr:hypothetical protein [Chloroflexota bacterium]